MLYFSENSGSYTFLEEGDRRNLPLIEDDSRIIWSVQAKSWDIASLKLHEFLGWEPYRPLISSQDDFKRILPQDKHDLESVRLLENLGYPAVKPIAADLLELMQDFNWPIAKKIAPFLVKIAPHITDELVAVLATEDSAWKYWILSEVVNHLPGDASGSLNKCLSDLRNNSQDDEEWDIEGTAREILNKWEYGSSNL